MNFYVRTKFVDLLLKAGEMNELPPGEIREAVADVLQGRNKYRSLFEEFNDPDVPIVAAAETDLDAVYVRLVSLVETGLRAFEIETNNTCVGVMK